MAVLGVKDSRKLEVIRPYRGRDKNFFSILNRSVEDLEQRDVDLDLIHTPSRGFRVRATSPVSDQVEIEGGIFLNGTTITQRSLATLASIPAASGSQKRIDLVYLRLDTNSIVRTASAEAASYGAVVKPNLPAGITALPLAYLYVGDTGPAFADGLAVDTDNAIEDIRLANGASPGRLFEGSVGNIAADSSGGSVGTLETVARSNHSHPLNVDGTLPTSLTPGNAAAAGSSNRYTRVDHVHQIPTETLAAVLRTDVSGGNVGVAGTFARSDHRHPLNVTATLPLTDTTGGDAGSSGFYSHSDHRHPLNVPSGGLPTEIEPGAGTQGVAATYSRSDHEHPFAGLQVSLFTFSWSNSDAVETTGALTFTPKFALLISSHEDGAGGGTRAGMSVGLIRGTGSESKSIAVAEKADGDGNFFTVSSDGDSAGGHSDTTGGRLTSHSLFEINCSAFSIAGVSLVPNVPISGVAFLLVVGDPA